MAIQRTISSKYRGFPTPAAEGTVRRAQETSSGKGHSPHSVLEKSSSSAASTRLKYSPLSDPKVAKAASNAAQGWISKSTEGSNRSGKGHSTTAAQKQEQSGKGHSTEKKTDAELAVEVQQKIHSATASIATARKHPISDNPDFQKWSAENNGKRTAQAEAAIAAQKKQEGGQVEQAGQAEPAGKAEKPEQAQAKATAKAKKANIADAKPKDSLPAQVEKALDEARAKKSPTKADYDKIEQAAYDAADKWYHEAKEELSWMNDGKGPTDAESQVLYQTSLKAAKSWYLNAMSQLVREKASEGPTEESIAAGKTAAAETGKQWVARARKGLGV